MTPRQLHALCDAHREFEGGTTRGGRQVVPGGSSESQRVNARASSAGGAGWLLAVATGLDRNRRHRARTMAPGVG